MGEQRRGRAVTALALCAATALGATVATGHAAAETNNGEAAAPHVERAAVAEAARTGERAEIEAYRTETAQVFAAPDGTLTLEQYTRPVRVLGDQGWQPVDTTLHRDQDGRVRTLRTPTDIAFGNGHGEPMATLAYDDHRLALDWPDELPEPELSDDTATYRDVLPGVDLELRADIEGFSQVLVVTTPEAARNPALDRLSYTLDVGDAEVRTDPESGVTTVVDDGEEIFAAGTPFMWDSAPLEDTAGTLDAGDGDAPVRSGREVAMPVEAGPGELAVLPRRDILDDPETVYPVYLDPGFAGSTLAWTHVNRANPAQSYWNYDRDEGAKVGYESRTGTTYRSYFRMRTEPVRGKQILSATLRIWSRHSWSCAPRATELWQTGDISAATTWNNRPARIRHLHTSTDTKGWGPNCPAGDVEFDATAAVRQSAAENRSTVTLGLQASNESDTYAWKRFRPNPVLVVDYNSYPNQPSQPSMQGGVVACAVGANRPWIPTTTPRLRARVSDPDGGLLTAHFEWGPVGQAATGTRSVSRIPSGSFAEITVPSGALRDGEAYFWRVRAHDGRVYSPFSQYCGMAIDTTAPHQSPAVSSTVYPPDQWSGGIGRTGEFTFDANGVDDVVRYLYSTEHDNPTTPVEADGIGGPATILVTPTSEGPLTLWVRSQDQAGNLSPITRYTYLVSGGSPPVSRWKFNEFDGATTPDSSGNGHTASVVGGVRWDGGHDYTAPHFDGSTGHLTTDTAGIRTDDSFAVSAWVHLADKGRFRTAVSQDATQASGYYLQYSRDDDRWAFALPRADGSSSGTARALSREPAETDGYWTHLSGVYDAAEQRITLYVNGVEQNTASVSSPWNAEGPVRIGAAQWNGQVSDFWSGAIDEVQVFDRALTGDEVARIFNESHLKGRWGLDEGTGDTAQDSSVWNRPGTVRGGATWRDDAYLGRPVLDLDGHTGHVDGLPVVATSQSFSITAWVRTEELGASAQTAVSMGSWYVSGSLLQYRPSSGKWAFMLPWTRELGGMDMAESARAARAGEWTHLVGVYDSADGEIRLYVDGQLAGHDDRVSSWNAEGGIQIGRATYTEADTDYWHGSLSDVRVYSGVLTEPQIGDLAHP
ncbi:LamG-like jellyroll fold domain-containing protein [Actinoalloteichus caeruleus]|uniref:Concanavalin A-like lectin/glucanases superfamily protein n=1 Tax=Actinoalloteichus caeruleus DSM 43889 TaxID=1120930 RepID=A0ABT1JG67_ACTCY|nr:LamG-like jellyroll fold domain-containing protein [Actinoalloteichus caeruleus]MCP2331279.1 Concanavalin A-like lectin/glucanases superfamily protein [Actinoalloteichus caeruleus DSM 43889]